MLPIGEFRQPRSGPLMLLFANSLDGVRGCLVSGFSPLGATGWSAVWRSEAPLAVQHSCPPFPKYFDGGRASPPVKIRALACFPNSLLATTNHIGVGRLVRPAERSSATHGIVIPNEPHLRTEESGRASNLEEEPCQSSPQLSADKSPKPLQKHGKSGVTTPTTNLLKMVFCSCAYVPLAGIRM